MAVPTVVLPTPLLPQTGGAERIPVQAGTAQEALLDLERRQPKLKGWVLDEHGRLREHVSLFVNERSAGLDHAVRDDDELFVVHAISGGEEPSVLAATRKGLFILRPDDSGGFRLDGRHFPGEVVEFALRDARSGRYFAGVTHGQFGPRLCWTDDLEKEWHQAEGPVFPEGTDSAVQRIWVIQPDETEGKIWAGVAPAALVLSTDNGESW